MCFLVLDAVLVDRMTNLAAMEVRKKFFRRTLRMELASFSEAKTAELMARFTADMDSLHGGIQTLLGRAVREPLEDAGLLCRRGGGVLAAVVRVALVIAGDRLFDFAAGGSLKRANRRAMEEITQLYSILGETLRQHQDRQGLYQRAARAAAIPPQQQGDLPPRDEDRALRRAGASADGNARRQRDFAVHLVRAHIWCSTQKTHLFGIQDVAAAVELERAVVVLWACWWGDRSSPQACPTCSIGCSGPRRRATGFIRCSIASRRFATRAAAKPLAAASARLRIRDVSFPYTPGQPVLDAGRPANPVRRDDGNCRPQRLRQDDARQPDSAVL